MLPLQVSIRKEEERKYGVFYNDDYNYLKHLKCLDEQGALVSTEKYHVVGEEEVRQHPQQKVYSNSVKRL